MASSILGQFLFSYHEPSGKPAAPNGHTRTASLNPLNCPLFFGGGFPGAVRATIFGVRAKIRSSMIVKLRQGRLWTKICLFSTGRSRYVASLLMS